MKAIAKFEKVSYEQFEKDWEKNMGGSKEEIKAIFDQASASCYKAVSRI